MNKGIFWVIVVMLGAVLAAGTAPCRGQGAAAKDAAAPAGSPAVDQAVAKVYPALVRIHVVVVSPADGRLRKMAASGSGAIISPEGYVVTNHHVAGKAERIICRLADGQEIDAVLVGTDPMTDISVLQLKLDQRKDPKAPVPTASFGDSDALRVGETVLAMGSPAGLSQSVTQGVVSNTQLILPGGSMSLDGESVGNLVRWIGHDATIYHGNSGGPLVNLRGEIVGINELGIGGIGGAIPSNLARQVVRCLISDRKVCRSYTGLECQAVLKNYNGPPGVLVAGVVPGSPAAATDIASGDVITELNGQKVSAALAEELPILNQRMASYAPGSKLRLTVWRAGATRTVELTTVERERALGKDEELKAWGMTASDFTMFSALELQRPDKDGVRVLTIRPGGPCSEAKPAILVGDVIVEVGGTVVRNVAELRKVTESVVKDSPKRVEALVGFERGVRKYLTVVRVGRDEEPKDPARSRKAWLGVATQVLTADLARALNLAGKSGVRVVQVMSGANAEKAGLKVGDIILKLDGRIIEARAVEDEEVFPNLIRLRDIDQKVRLDVVRDGQPLQVEVVLETPPAPGSELESHKDVDFEFTAREMSFFDRTEKKLDPKLEGVLVHRVEPAGWAALGGLDAGDVLMSVDGKAVASIRLLREALSAARKAKATRVVFQIRRGVHTAFLEISPAWE